MFCRVSEKNTDVRSILEETCFTLEKIHIDTSVTTNESHRKSIVDPLMPKMKGPRTVSTSARVDLNVVPVRSKMVDDFQTKILGRSKASKTKKRHKCSVCRVEGHHANTCKSILLEENRIRADAFLKTLVETKRLKSYLKGVSSRSRDTFVQAVIQRLRKITKLEVDDVL